MGPQIPASRRGRDRSPTHMGNVLNKNGKIRRNQMKYMLLIVQKSGVPVPESRIAEALATFQKIGQDLTAQRQLVHSARLRSAEETTLVKLSPGAQPTVVDGPFAESKETVG